VTSSWELQFVAAARRGDEGDPQAAIDIFTRMLEQDDVPAYARSLAGTNIASMLLKLQRLDEAMEWYERAVALDPEGEGAAVALGAKGMTLHALERFHECIATFERLLELPALPEESRVAAEHNLRALRGE